jgi:hypothetical protein
MNADFKNVYEFGMFHDDFTHGSLRSWGFCGAAKQHCAKKKKKPDKLSGNECSDNEPGWFGFSSAATSIKLYLMPRSEEHAPPKAGRVKIFRADSSSNHVDGDREDAEARVLAVAHLVAEE